MLEGNGKRQNEIHGRPTLVSMIGNNKEHEAAYSLASKSSLPSSPARSAVLTQMVRARLRDVWLRSAQYFLPSAHLWRLTTVYL